MGINRGASCSQLYIQFVLLNGSASIIISVSAHETGGDMTHFYAFKTVIMTAYKFATTLYEPRVLNGAEKAMAQMFSASELKSID
jgi:hypothetical protein